MAKKNSTNVAANDAGQNPETGEIPNATQAGYSYNMHPRFLLISGIDYTDPNGFLEDSRAHLARGADDVAKARIESIRRNGVVEPVVVVLHEIPVGSGITNAGKAAEGTSAPVVDDGRQRVLDARHVDDGRMVPFVVRDMSTIDAERLALELNALRTVDSQLVEAYKAKRAIDTLGMTPEDLCASMGWSKATLKNRIALTMLCEDVQAYVRDGKLSPIAAASLSKMPPEKQVEEAKKLVAAKAEGKGQTQAAAVAKRQSKGEEDISVKPTKSLVKRVLKTKAAEDLEDQVIRALRWMIGEGSHTKVTGLAACLNEIEKKEAEKSERKRLREVDGKTTKKKAPPPKTIAAKKNSPTNKPSVTVRKPAKK